MSIQEHTPGYVHLFASMVLKRPCYQLRVNNLCTMSDIFLSYLTISALLNKDAMNQVKFKYCSGDYLLLCSHFVFNYKQSSELAPSGTSGTFKFVMLC